MPTPTYEPIQTVTLAAPAASITLSSIPSTYTDIRVVLSGIGGTAPGDTYVRFNGDTATNYSNTILTGNGTSATSVRNTSSTAIKLDDAGGFNTSYPAMVTIDLMRYSGGQYKTLLGTNQADRNGSGGVDRVVGLWRSTAAINSLTFLLFSGTFGTGTTATIYGIKAA